jgi:hypothetical protein
MFQVSTDAGSRPWTLSRDLDAGQGSALPCCAYIQSVCLPVYSTWRDSTSKTRQLTCRKGLPLPPKTDTRLPSASPPPATCASSSSSTATTPCSPLLPSRLSLSLSLSPLFQLPTAYSTTTTTTARRCLYPLVHASFDVANGLSYFHHQLHAALIHSFIRTQHLRAGHLTPHSPQHNINHTHTRLTRTAHSPPSHITQTSSLRHHTPSSDHYTLNPPQLSTITTTLDAQQRKPWPIPQREDEHLRRRIWRRAQEVQHGKHLWRPFPTGYARNWHCKTPCGTCSSLVAEH